MSAVRKTAEKLFGHFAKMPFIIVHSMRTNRAVSHDGIAD
jgi:hypothetical protein